jgi:phage tail-like protein
MAPRDKSFAFVVEIDGIERAAFTECSELSMEVGEMKYREGGTLVEEKEAGLVTFPDITLKRGKISDRSFYNWIKDVINVTSGLANVPGATYKRNLDVVQLDRDGSEIRRYPVIEAWPKTRKVGPWNNNSEDYVMEEMVLSCKSWDEL